MKKGPTENHHVFAGALRGVVWAYLASAGSRLLSFIAIVILARLLTPIDFGQVGLALVLIGYLTIIGDLGVSHALIYEREWSKSTANVAFIISLAAGTLWFISAQAVAPLAAAFFREPAVEPIFRILAWTFLIEAMGSTHDAILQRNLAFKKRLIPEFADGAFRGVVAIMLAVMGWGVWSLVWGHLIGTVAAVVARWIIVEWRPQMQFAYAIARRVMRYGSRIIMARVIRAYSANFDYLVVARVLGSASLGFYMLAYRIPEIAITMIIWAIGEVMFPTFSRLQGDRVVMGRAFLTSLRYASLVTIPAAIGLALLASPAVITLYGENWQPSIPVLQALAITVGLRSLGTNTSSVCKAIGRPGILVKLELLRAALLIPSLIVGARYGIVGVAIAKMVVTAIGVLLNWLVAARVLSLPFKSILTELKTVAWSSVAMAACLYIALPYLSFLPHTLALVVGVGVGFSAYTLCVWLMDREALLYARTAIVVAFRGSK